MAAVPRRGRRAHRARPGAARARPAAHRAPCLDADGQPHAREGALPGGRRLRAGCPGARADARRNPRHPRRHARGARSLRARCALREPERPVLRLAVLFRPLGQPRRVCPVLPAGLRPRRRRGAHRRQAEAPPLTARHEPYGRPGGDAGRRGQFPENRRPTEGHGLRQERHGPLPPAARRHPPASAGRLPAGLAGRVAFQLQPRAGQELQPGVYGLLPARPHGRHVVVRHPQGDGRARRPCPRDTRPRPAHRRRGRICQRRRAVLR